MSKNSGEPCFFLILISTTGGLFYDKKYCCDNLWDSAKERHASWIHRTTDLDVALDIIETNQGIAEIPFCGSEECAADIEQRIDGLKFLGIPDEYLSVLHKEVQEESDIYCVHCSKLVKQYWRIGRPY